MKVIFIRFPYLLLIDVVSAWSVILYVSSTDWNIESCCHFMLRIRHWPMFQLQPFSCSFYFSTSTNDVRQQITCSWLGTYFVIQRRLIGRIQLYNCLYSVSYLFLFNPAFIICNFLCKTFNNGKNKLFWNTFVF